MVVHAILDSPSVQKGMAGSSWECGRARRGPRLLSTMRIGNSLSRRTAPIRYADDSGNATDAPFCERRGVRAAAVLAVRPPPRHDASSRKMRAALAVALPAAGPTEVRSEVAVAEALRERGGVPRGLVLVYPFPPHNELLFSRDTYRGIPHGAPARYRYGRRPAGRIVPDARRALNRRLAAPGERGALAAVFQQS